VSGPTFVSKHRGFLGIAFFYADDPAKLPWTTTKRAINRDSSLYIVARKEMAALARPVLDFLNNMYSEPEESRAARELIKDLQPAKLSAVVAGQAQEFARDLPRRSRKPVAVSVQFEAPIADIERVKKKISRPSWGAGKVGRYTFEHFLRTECST
jgi:hypothetical protein